MRLVVVLVAGISCLTPAREALSIHRAAASISSEVAEKALSLSVDDLATLVGGKGRAQSIWSAIRQGIEPLSAHSGITPKTRHALAYAGITDKLVPGSLDGEPARAVDGTTKLLVRLDDGLAVETVIIPHLRLPRTTLCVSTQVGCDRGCTFCATARMGLVRNLRADEIAAQFYHARRHIQSGAISCAPLTNVVFMGMGDAGRNAANAAIAASILTDDDKFGLAKSRVTISTVGPSPACFKALSRAPAMLAWSIHSADDDLRRRLVPTHGTYTVVELRDALAEALTDRKAVRTRTLMLAATLISGINDSDEDAHRLALFIGPLVDVARKVNVDLIPVNPVAHAPHFARPTDERLAEFAAVIRRFEKRVHVALRVQRGDEKSAACGQLAVYHTKAERIAARRAQASVSNNIKNSSPENQGIL